MERTLFGSVKMQPDPDIYKFGDPQPRDGIQAPQSSRSAVLLGLVAVITAVFVFGIWSMTAMLDSAVIAQGKLIVAGKRKQVQHLEGGIVKSIAVRDGDYVREGDILVERDPLKSHTRFVVSRTGYFNHLAAEARLVAERDNLDDFKWPGELIEAMSANPEVLSMAKAQERIIAARGQERLGQSRILESRIERLQEQIKGFEAERHASHMQLNVARDELKTLEDLYERKHTTRMRLLVTKREVFQLEGNIGRLDGLIASLAKEIGETHLNLAQIQKKHMTDVLDELKQHQAKVLDFREQFNVTKGEADRTIIRAPSSGTVFGSQVHTIGGVIRSGDSLLEIVPDNDRLVVEVKVRHHDVDNVHIGQPTEVRITAFKQRTTPALKGKVTSIPADTVSENKRYETYYMANIEVETSELLQFDATQRLQAGMTAEVVIKTGERTAMAYLLQPLTESVNRAWREN
jgi:HlyD family type I secretion membrane fusion protein